MARLHRVEWLESQLNDKDEVNALVKRRLEQAEAHIQSLDKSWNQSRGQTEKAESIAIEYANEIKKGNSVIERLANELKAVKSKSNFDPPCHTTSTTPRRTKVTIGQGFRR